MLDSSLTLVTPRAVNAAADAASDWEPIVPLPPFIAETGATTAVWMPRDATGERTISADGGDSPGIFTITEAYKLPAGGKLTTLPAPDEIQHTLREWQADWTDEDRLHHAPYFRVHPIRYVPPFVTELDAADSESQ